MKRIKGVRKFIESFLPGKSCHHNSTSFHHSSNCCGDASSDKTSSFFKIMFFGGNTGELSTDRTLSEIIFTAPNSSDFSRILAVFQYLLFGFICANSFHF
jgi:hypothetical protein